MFYGRGSQNTLSLLKEITWLNHVLYCHLQINSSVDSDRLILYYFSLEWTITCPSWPTTTFDLICCHRHFTPVCAPDSLLTQPTWTPKSTKSEYICLCRIGKCGKLRANNDMPPTLNTVEETSRNLSEPIQQPFGVRKTTRMWSFNVASFAARGDCCFTSSHL